MNFAYKRILQFLFIPFLILIASSSFAESPEEGYLFSDNLKLGKYDEWVSEGLDYIEKNPETPMAELILRSVFSSLTYLKSDKSVIERLEKLLQNKFPEGFNKLILKQLILKFYLKNGFYKSADSLSKDAGSFIT